jgi:hypothetical protein
LRRSCGGLHPIGRSRERGRRLTIHRRFRPMPNFCQLRAELGRVGRTLTARLGTALGLAIASPPSRSVASARARQATLTPHFESGISLRAPSARRRCRRDWGRKMSVLSYQCPKTSHDVRTSIDTDPQTLTRLRDLKVAVACPYCVEGHRIPANEMYFGQVPWPTPSTQSWSQDRGEPC